MEGKSMASELVQMKCTACRGGEPTLTDAEVADLHPQVPEWSVVERGDGIKRLERAFKFKNFAEALLHSRTAWARLQKKRNIIQQS